jgi:hypothetical protein
MSPNGSMSWKGIVHNLEKELAETQERLDFNERLLHSAREERRLE